MSAEDKMSEEQKITLARAKAILGGEKLVLGGPLNKGFTPRSIEVPWAASHIRRDDTILDVGFSLANLDYLGLLLEAKNKHGVIIEAVDIIEPQKVMSRYPDEWQSEVVSVPVLVGDVRNVELPQAKYDKVLCISTLEHIGYDAPATTVENSAFERPADKDKINLVRDPQTHAQVLAAWHGALKSGGEACVSVPMGRGEPIITQDSRGLFSVEWEYEEKSWRELTTSPLFDLIEERFFKNTPGGWVAVTSPADLADVTGMMNSRQGVGFALCTLKKK